MDARPEFMRQNLIHHAVAGDARLSPERLRYDFDAEMAFTERMAAGMACVLIAFVNHTKYGRLESRHELLLQ